MNITETRYHAFNNPESKTLGSASVTLNGEVVISNISVVKGKNGPFISFPQRKGKDKDGKEKYFDIAYPLTAELRNAITDAIFTEANISGEANTSTPETSSEEKSAAEDDLFPGW